MYDGLGIWDGKAGLVWAVATKSWEAVPIYGRGRWAASLGQAACGLTRTSHIRFLVTGSLSYIPACYYFIFCCLFSCGEEIG